ncbi:DUF6168 family protein [Mesonia sp. K7]|uniref:DUF6168 family protein n=1 Tax=Mesonia sp. K7 TaxID=2218606 RepID=UPI000DAACAF1|nr:DUF6168 family protein [Mesonia sp. K7]PZD79082.1 hypothetical protein DNG35_03490 [Mesonia sp. K7]
MKSKYFLKYIFIIAISGLVGFFIHRFILSELVISASYLFWCYFANIILAVVVLSVLYILRKKFKDQLGFLFMAGSFLKFAAFFIFFYPIFREDDAVTKVEFTSFFIPYVICLITETLGGIKLLAKQNYDV